MLPEDCVLLQLQLTRSEIYTTDYREMVVYEISPSEHVRQAVNRSQRAAQPLLARVVLGSASSPQVVDGEDGLGEGGQTRPHHRRRRRRAEPRGRGRDHHVLLQQPDGLVRLPPTPPLQLPPQYVFQLAPERSAPEHRRHPPLSLQRLEVPLQGVRVRASLLVLLLGWWQPFPARFHEGCRHWATWSVRAALFGN